MGFGGFHFGNARISMIGYLPFLSFMVSLVGVGFDLDFIRDLGMSANISATSGAPTSTPIAISYTLSSVAILSVSITYL